MPPKPHIISEIQRALATSPLQIAPAANPATPPEAYALPSKGRDPWFNCTRSWYYAAEKQGLIRLIRIRGRGKLRGIVRVPYDDMANLFREARQ